MIGKKKEACGIAGWARATGGVGGRSGAAFWRVKGGAAEHTGRRGAESRWTAI